MKKWTAKDELRVAVELLAKWIKPGTTMDYCSIIGEPPTKRGLTVRSDPFQASDGSWVVFLNGHSGYVSVLAVQPAEPQPTTIQHEIDAALDRGGL